MITSFCDRLRALLAAEIDHRRDALEKGTPNDERQRGEIWAFRKAGAFIDDLEELARKQDTDD